MNLKPHIHTRRGPAASKDGLAAKEHKDHKENKRYKFLSMCSLRSFVAKKSRERAIALVITLLMLAVITFLAIAFLAMTTRDKGAVNASLDANTARSMSDAALARAQAGIIAQMMSVTDVLSYDYTASHNFINPNGFNTTEGTNDPNNVNYDWFLTNNGSLNPNWAQNIANLFYDPRPPVFVVTNANGNPAPPSDFRYWVDINRNGRFESNGMVQMLDDTGTFIPGLSNFYNGEPEWIGVLKYPETNHSPTNPFIGRYAFMALPIGKTLDFNFIHNYSRELGNSSSFNSPTPDNFIRDEGVGSWELNLAALLNDINTNIYPPTGPDSYFYNTAPFTSPNAGFCFYDAAQFIRFRYAGYAYAANYPQILNVALQSLTTHDLNIDEYGAYPSTSLPFDYTGLPATNAIWPGGYNTNMFYDVQDLFNTNNTGPSFAPDLLAFMTTNQDSYNRYTFQRLLACIGTSSSPEYGIYVYSNFFTNNFTNNNILTTTNIAGNNIIISNSVMPLPSLLRTKVNINYDNTAQIQAGPYNSYGAYTPMPTNLVSWTNAQNNGLNFFTNAADLLLRSQIFVFTNYVTNNGTGQYYVPVNTPSNYILTTFGITNIPVYNSTNPGIVYNEQVHRMLQMAANIYADANPSNGPNGYPIPPVFRPQFLVTQSNGVNFVYITNFVQVTNDAYTQMNYPFYDLTNVPNLPLPHQLLTGRFNFWGVPWVVGAVKGIPEFDQYNYQYRVFYQRALQFIRHSAGNGLWATNLPPQYTNQYYEMSVSNICGMDAWNPYSSNFPASVSLYVVASNYIAVTITNNFNFSITNYYTNSATNIIGLSWPANTFQTFLQTNFVSLPYSYFSEFATHGFVQLPYNNSQSTNQTFLPGDTNQGTYPTHYWTVSVTNHLFYTLFDGTLGSGTVLDFVNVGPFGSSFPISQYLLTNNNPADPFSFPQTPNPNPSANSWWTISNATDAGSTVISLGVLNQINRSISAQGTFTADLYGLPGGDPATISTFTTPPLTSGLLTNAIGPFANYAYSNSLAACDPLVHYTLGDLTYPQNTNITMVWTPSDNPLLPSPWQTNLGMVTTRYELGIGMATSNIVFADPGMTSANAWQFPTNLFPGVGWLGRVHRGTPWQTVYLKPDDPIPTNSYINWSTHWVNSQYTYPTNDWSLVDLFTAVPNDNAARGLLSVNQTNDPAWAAVFAGVIALTSPTNGIPINPTTDVSNLMDGPYGINVVRTNQPNGIFHNIGDILQAPALTTQSPFVVATPPYANLTDEMVERIPQQTLSLLRLGMPQFVIYSWGQSLKPKNLYSALGASASLQNICTNYEITGEFLTRTVCHVVSDPGAAAPKIIIDSYNIEPGN
jgi:hypothetical protein